MKLNFNIPNIQNLILVIFSICFYGCIKPLDQEPAGFQKYLVIEGGISNNEGPHGIKVTRISKFAGVPQGGEIRILDADVTIIDQNGTKTRLERRDTLRKEIYNVVPEGCAPGVSYIPVITKHYTPNNFKAQLGNSYTLEIKIDGKTYRSTPQKVLPTPPINSVEAIFKELPSIDPVTKPSGLDIYSEWKDPVDEQNFYSWRINGTYHINTPPLPSPACCLYDQGESKNCWIVEKNMEGNEISFSDQSFDGQTVKKKVGFIADDGYRFASTFLPDDKKYYVEVEQYQISQQAFDFFEGIKALFEIDGEIFDPLPLTIRGNIFNVENPEEPVIGFFGAYDIQKKGIFIPESTFKVKQRFPNPCGDCRVRAGAQIETPKPFL